MPPATGMADRHLRPIDEPLRFAEELELDYPVELLEPLAFILGRLLHDLLARLSSRALATDEIRVALTLENMDPPSVLKYSPEMETERLKIAVRVLNAFCACVFPHIEDVIALREMAESAKRAT